MSSHVGKLLTVVVFDSRVMLGLLALLNGAVSNLLSSQFALILTVGKKLLASEVLLLEGPKIILLFLACLKHFVILNLEGTLMHDSGLLLGGETLEAIGLNAVGCESALLRHGVLGHEIVCHREVHFVHSIGILFTTFSLIAVTLLLGCLLVVVNN